MKLTVGTMHFQKLNEQIRACTDRDITLENCIGQRYIGSGLCDKNLYIDGIAGNALGAYLGGGKIVTSGNAQDATGDTMNDGTIIVNGSCGDATGYGMRRGKIFIRGDIGYRAGIHMKSYKEKLPVMVVGGCAGSFLGEYQAGGIIVVLGLHQPKEVPVTGHFCGTGMHGGRIFLRCETPPSDLPNQIMVKEASEDDLAQIEQYLDEFCAHFGEDKTEILSSKFYILTPNSKNPYKQLYTIY